MPPHPFIGNGGSIQYRHVYRRNLAYLTRDQDDNDTDLLVMRSTGPEIGAALSDAVETFHRLYEKAGWDDEDGDDWTDRLGEKDLKGRRIQKNGAHNARPTDFSSTRADR